MDNSNAHEEKIYVAVRARPLNDKEISKNDLSDWECISDTTIIFKNTTLPTGYTFDRVFGFDSPTKHVYDEAAKKIALSVLSGINSTIFAYGQTGSGKTFTMCGITECAIADIYDYIHKHPERKFRLKFSAMEIYNEAVRDLLRTDDTSLRLLDDPERGTIVANLTEVTLKNWRQLKDLLSVCEAQRKIGETSLNELSSRSHQILRLTVESEAVHGGLSTLTASVSFVDLAGSERACHFGTRLKEGSHINRSLLTLGTVIRKLSKGGKNNGHIPYRDSKLTRILQNSLGGNARSAVICTMSPAHSQVEQSRNTLHFANSANQVSTSAHANVVMSEKALVKQLQKELARMETELNIISHSKSALKEKQDLIQKMDEEIRELTHQRDVAQSRVDDMMRSWTDSSSRSSSASISATSSPRYRHPSCETAANQESLSVKKTLVAVIGDNSPRLSDARMLSTSHHQSRASSDATTLSYSDSLSRQSSDVKMLSNIESPKSKAKAVKQIEHHLESTVSSAEANCGAPTKAKKKRRSSREICKKEATRLSWQEEDWNTEFERRKMEIIKLWDACHIPLVHRSYFCLLFKGDPSDAVYMEVEQRRLSFLKNGEGPCSPKGLQREREMLSKRMLKKLSSREREGVFDKWGIDVKSKHRRQQLCRKLWTDTENMEHIKESAEMVAKLAGLSLNESSKEMFGLTLAPKHINSKPSFSWRNPIPSIIS